MLSLPKPLFQLFASLPVSLAFLISAQQMEESHSSFDEYEIRDDVFRLNTTY